MPDPADIFSAVVAAPFGRVGVHTEGFLVRELVYLPPHYLEKAPEDALADKVARQLQRYFVEPDFRFDLPLKPSGTEYQNRVWQAIAAIPRGSVLTYGSLARQLQSAPRAIGQACGANYFPLIIPCHRVTATGGLGGFANQSDAAGFHLSVKRWLLAHEGVAQYASLPFSD